MTPHKGFAKLELQFDKAITSTRMPGTSEEDLVLQLKRNQTQNEPDTKTEPDTKMPCCSTLRPVVLPSQCREIARKRASVRASERERETLSKRERERERERNSSSQETEIRNCTLHRPPVSSQCRLEEREESERGREQGRESEHTLGMKTVELQQADDASQRLCQT